MSETPKLDHWTEVGARAISPNAHEPWLAPVRKALIAIARDNGQMPAVEPTKPPVPFSDDPAIAGTGRLVGSYGRVGIAKPGESPQETVKRERAARGLAAQADKLGRGEDHMAREADRMARELDPVGDDGPTELSKPRPKADPDKAKSLEMAKAMGFTGDICTTCGSPNMKRNGSCMVCSDCGTTTGCS